MIGITLIALEIDPIAKKAIGKRGVRISKKIPTVNPTSANHLYRFGLLSKRDPNFPKITLNGNIYHLIDIPDAKSDPRHPKPSLITHVIPIAIDIAAELNAAAEV
jgi:hypothetical protein